MEITEIPKIARVRNRGPPLLRATVTLHSSIRRSLIVTIKPSRLIVTVTWLSLNNVDHVRLTSSEVRGHDHAAGNVSTFSIQKVEIVLRDI